jgi:hypothetical protein
MEHIRRQRYVYLPIYNSNSKITVKIHKIIKQRPFRAGKRHAKLNHASKMQFTHFGNVIFDENLISQKWKKKSG